MKPHDGVFTAALAPLPNQASLATPRKTRHPRRSDRNTRKREGEAKRRSKWPPRDISFDHLMARAQMSVVDDSIRTVPSKSERSQNGHQSVPDTSACMPGVETLVPHGNPDNTVSLNNDEEEDDTGFDLATNGPQSHRSQDQGTTDHSIGAVTHIQELSIHSQATTAMSSIPQTTISKASQIDAPSPPDPLHRLTLPRNTSNRVNKPKPPTRLIHASMNNTRLPFADHSSRLHECVDSIISDVKAENQCNREKILSLEQLVATQKTTINVLQESTSKSRTQCARHIEVANKMQKYVSGMESDQKKLKAATQLHQSTCSRILEETTKQYQQDKRALRDDFNKTLDVMQKSHRSMKSALDECHLALILSDSKQNALATRFKAQQSLLQKEQKRCQDLEQQILPLMQTLQRDLTDDTSPLMRKLSNVETSVHDTIAKKIPDGVLQECFELVKSLKESPFLAVSDVKKAEGMLRFVHERF